MFPHVPSLPFPFLLAVHASHVPEQSVSQQTPSMQKPDEHCDANVHAAPLGCVDWA
jgi:hypothetical protein